MSSLIFTYFSIASGTAGDCFYTILLCTAGSVPVQIQDIEFTPESFRLLEVSFPEEVSRSDLQVTGAHTGQMKLCLTLQSDERFQIYPDPDQSYGFAEFDGVRREVGDISL